MLYRFAFSPIHLFRLDVHSQIKFICVLHNFGFWFLAILYTTSHWIAWKNRNLQAPVLTCLSSSPIMRDDSVVPIIHFQFLHFHVPIPFVYFFPFSLFASGCCVCVCVLFRAFYLWPVVICILNEWIRFFLCAGRFSCFVFLNEHDNARSISVRVCVWFFVFGKYTKKDVKK